MNFLIKREPRALLNFVHVAACFVLFGTSGPSASASLNYGFRPNDFVRQSRYLLDVNTYVGYDPDMQKIPQPRQVQDPWLNSSPYSSVLTLARYNQNRKPLGGCTAFVAGNPHIVLTAAHCFFEDNKDPRTHKPKRVPILNAFFGVKNGRAKAGRILGQPCYIGTENPSQNPSNDFVAFYVKDPIPGVTPLKIPSARNMPRDCENHLYTAEFLPHLNKSKPNQMYYVPQCRREVELGQFIDKNYTLFHYNQNPHLLADDCGDGNGSSGAPLYCYSSNGKPALFGMRVGGILPQGHHKAVYGVQLRPNTVNYDAPLSHLVKGINKCLQENNQPPIKSIPISQSSGSVVQNRFKPFGL